MTGCCTSYLSTTPMVLIVHHQQRCTLICNNQVLWTVFYVPSPLVLLSPCWTRFLPPRFKSLMSHQVRVFRRCGRSSLLRRHPLTSSLQSPQFMLRWTSSCQKKSILQFWSSLQLVEHHRTAEMAEDQTVAALTRNLRLCVRWNGVTNWMKATKVVS